MRIGVAGVGKLGEFHTDLLKQMAAEAPDAEFSGVFDLNPERLQEIGKKDGVACFSTLEEVAAGQLSAKNPIKHVATKKILEQFGEIQESLKDMALDYVSPDVPKINALKEELEQFIEAIGTDKPAKVTSEEGRHALMVAGKITDEIRKKTADLD